MEKVDGPIWLDETPKSYRPVSASDRIDAVLPRGTRFDDRMMIEQLRTAVAKRSFHDLHAGVQVVLRPDDRPDIIFFERKPSVVSRLGQLSAALLNIFEII